VLHRDIKPGNIILGDYGEVLVIDWGLAKALDGPELDTNEAQRRRTLPKPATPKTPAHPDDTAAFHLDATEAGQIKGTPAYMSPEQAEGKSATTASDVYALGATLYNILTGTLPFTGDSSHEVIRNVIYHDLRSPRQLNPAVPPALDAICLKAMARDPQERYESALALAQDVGNWLDDIPTTAWPEPFAVRTRRWMSKHRAVVVGLAAALAMFVILAGVWTVRERTLNKELRLALKAAQDERTRAEKEKKLAEFQAKRADDNYRQARSTVQNMLFRTNEPRWNDVLKIQQLRKEQSELVLSFFEAIAAQPGQEAGVRADVAWGLVEAGKLQIGLGKDAEGRDKLRQALEATEKLYNEAQDNPVIGMLRSDALLAFGAYQNVDRGLPLIEQAVEVLEANWKKHPDAMHFRGALIDGLITLGGALINKQDYHQAEKKLVRAVELSEELLKATPGDMNRLAACAGARVNLCAAYRHSQRPKQAREQHMLAERDLEQLFKIDPFDRATINALAVLRVNGAYDLAAEGKKAEAVEYVQRNTPMLEAALKLEPNDLAYRDGLYRTHGLAAMFLREIGKTREAAEAWEKSVALVVGQDKPLRLVEAVEFWIDAKDLPRAIEAAKRASAELPLDAPAALWNRQSMVLERLARLVGSDEQLAAEERTKLVIELRTMATFATTRAGANSALPILQNALDFFRPGKP
jgi:tetratricopeptide (TPR) repeat protein